MNYTQYKEDIQKKINDFPFMFAFNEKQFEEGKQKLGVKENSELYSIEGGGYIRKKDSDAFKELIDENHSNLMNFLEVEEQLLEAFEYELANHEYCITYDHTPTLEALGLSFEELTDKQKDILKKAKDKYIAKT